MRRPGPAGGVRGRIVRVLLGRSILGLLVPPQPQALVHQLLLHRLQAEQRDRHVLILRHLAKHRHLPSLVAAEHPLHVHRQAVDPAEILRIGVSHDHQLSAHSGPEPEPQRVGEEVHALTDGWPRRGAVPFLVGFHEPLELLHDAARLDDFLLENLSHDDLAKHHLHGRVIIHHLLQRLLLEGVAVAEGERHRLVPTLHRPPEHVLPEARVVPDGSYPPLAHDHPRLEHEELVALVPLGDDELLGRERLQDEVEADLDGDLLRDPVEDLHLDQPRGVDLRGNLLSHARRHKVEQLAPRNLARVLAPVPEERAEPPGQVHVDLRLLDEQVEPVHQLLELGLPVVHAREDAADGTHDVRVDGCAHQHADDEKHALGFRLRRDVSVPDGRYRHRGQVQGGEVERSSGDVLVVVVRVVVETVAVVVVGDPVAPRLLHDLDQVPEAGHPVRDEEGTDDELGQLEGAVVDGHGVLEPREDAARSEDAEQLCEADDSHNSQNLEVRLAPGGERDVVVGEDGDEVDDEEPFHIPLRDHLPVRDHLEPLLVKVHQVKVENHVEEERQVDAHVHEVHRRQSLLLHERNLVRGPYRGVQQQPHRDHVPPTHERGERVDQAPRHGHRHRVVALRDAAEQMLLRGHLVHLLAVIALVQLFPPPHRFHFLRARLVRARARGVAHTIARAESPGN